MKQRRRWHEEVRKKRNGGVRRAAAAGTGAAVLAAALLLYLSAMGGNGRDVRLPETRSGAQAGAAAETAQALPAFDAAPTNAPAGETAPAKETAPANETVPTGDGAAAALPAAAPPPAEAPSDPAAQTGFFYEEGERRAAPQLAAGAPAAMGDAALIETGPAYTGALQAATDTRVYSFRLYERGVFNFTLKNQKTGDAAGWNAALYLEYSINGSGGEKGYRLLHTLSASLSAARSVSPNIGLGIGNYYIVISAGDRFTEETYTLSTNFTPTADYEIECNDTVYRYTEIFGGIPVKGSASLPAEGQDRDYYMIRLPRDGALRLTFAHAAQKQGTVAFQIVLYDEALRELYSGASLLSSAVLSSGTVGLPKGNYYIGVFSRVYMAEDYTLTAEAVYGDGFEKENNDTLAAATPIAPGTDCTGALVTRSVRPDRDYYALTLPRDGVLSVALTNVRTTEPAKNDEAKMIRRLRVLTPDGTAVCSAVLAENERQVVLPALGLSAGQVILLVDNTDLYENSGDYTLSCAFTAADGWEREPNNTAARALPLSPGEKCTGTIADDETAFDSDYYTFTLASPAAVTLHLSHDMIYGTGDVFAAAVYDKDEAVCLSDRKAAALLLRRAESHTAQSYTLPAGTYYVRVVSGTFHTDTPYTVWVETK